MFELLFLLVVLATLIVALLTVINLIKRRFAQTGRLLLRYGLGLILYFLILLSISLISPQRVVAMKEERCFDDWCVTIEDINMQSEIGNVKPDGIFYVVTIQLSNHSRGRSQRASSVALHLLDASRKRYDISAQGQSALEVQVGTIPPLTVTMDSGQSVITYQVFDLPKDIGEVTLTVEHPIGFTPSWFVIGDEDSLLHKPTIVRLP